MAEFTRSQLVEMVVPVSMELLRPIADKGTGDDRERLAFALGVVRDALDMIERGASERDSLGL